MKKIILITFSLLLFLPRAASAQTPDTINRQIDELKNKVASKVASLKLVEKRGVIGTVTSASPTEIVLSDINGNQIDIDVDELTNFSSDQKSSFDISDIKKSMQISVLGLYNKDSQRLLARFVQDYTIPIFIPGVIASKDAKNFTVNLSTSDHTSYTVDIEDVTKTLLYSDESFDESGFSKIPTLVNAVVVGFPNPKEKNGISASRILIFPNTPRDPKIQIVQDQNSTSSSQ